jgi:hypothetical protein
MGEFERDPLPKPPQVWQGMPPADRGGFTPLTRWFGNRCPQTTWFSRRHIVLPQHVLRRYEIVPQWRKTGEEKSPHPQPPSLRLPDGCLSVNWPSDGAFLGRRRAVRPSVSPSVRPTAGRPVADGRSVGTGRSRSATAHAATA